MLRICAVSLLATLLWAAEPADWIVSARWVLTMDREGRLIENGAVAVRGARIAAVGTKAEIERRYRGRKLDCGPCLLAPGLVNAHTHAPMSLMRGLADDRRLQEWLEQYIFPAEARNVDAEFVRWGTRLACLEMMLSGTTTFAEMYYFEDFVAEAAREAGMRAVLGETIIDFPAPDFKTPQAALEFTERFIRRFRDDPLVVPAVAPHSHETTSEAVFRASRALANRYGVPLMTHLAETRQGREQAEKLHGLSPVRLLESWGVFEGRTVAAHVVWVDEGDLEILRQRTVGIAHCPSSNAKLASGVAPVTRMLAMDLAVGLGTDGPAGSNNDFNLFEEMDLAAKLQKIVTGDPRALSARQAVEMATIRGARALGLADRIGSLEPGKLADLITVRLDRVHAVPLYDVYSQMVYALKGADVRDVMVHGRWLVRDGRPLTLDAAQVTARAAAYAQRIRTSLAGSRP
ncbi:MAG: amidohydrolase [Bryobacterales bacterium]|nr:amidohydrolase [Bryobacteraceae bacterium]MDW8129940.1 amidohydrolase [Bryobacterales bacterium]